MRGDADEDEEEALRALQRKAKATDAKSGGADDDLDFEDLADEQSKAGGTAGAGAGARLGGKGKGQKGKEKPPDEPVSMWERVVVHAPFSLYLGWVSFLVALQFMYLAAIDNWGLLGLTDSAWAVIIMCVLTIAGLGVLVRRKDPVFPLGILFALLGIFWENTTGVRGARAAPGGLAPWAERIAIAAGPAGSLRRGLLARRRRHVARRRPRRVPGAHHVHHGRARAARVRLAPLLEPHHGGRVRRSRRLLRLHHGQGARCRRPPRVATATAHDPWPVAAHHHPQCRHVLTVRPDGTLVDNPVTCDRLGTRDGEFIKGYAWISGRCVEDPGLCPYELFKVPAAAAPPGCTPVTTRGPRAGQRGLPHAVLRVVDDRARAVRPARLGNVRARCSHSVHEKFDPGCALLLRRALATARGSQPSARWTNASATRS